MKVYSYNYSSDTGNEFVVSYGEAAVMALAAYFDDGSFEVIEPPSQEETVSGVWYSGVTFTFRFLTNEEVEIEKEAEACVQYPYLAETLNEIERVFKKG